MAAPVEPRHNADHHRFVVDLDDGEAVLTYREKDADVWDFTHTYVPPEHRDRDIGESLVLGALDRARELGKRVVPTCPFVRSVLKDHEEYADMIEEKS